MKGWFISSIVSTDIKSMVYRSFVLFETIHFIKLDAILLYIQLQECLHMYSGGVGSQLRCL